MVSPTSTGKVLLDKVLAATLPAYDDGPSFVKEGPFSRTEAFRASAQCQ